MVDEDELGDATKAVTRLNRELNDSVAALKLRFRWNMGVAVAAYFALLIAVFAGYKSIEEAGQRRDELSCGIRHAFETYTDALVRNAPSADPARVEAFIADYTRDLPPCEEDK